MTDQIRRGLLKSIPISLVAFMARDRNGIVLATPQVQAVGRARIDVPSQDNWKWCAKCQGLWFDGNATKGPCPASGAHDRSRSSNYSLVRDTTVAGAQNNWRWCRKCQVLWFNGNATKGVCPGGGAHESAGSSDYVLAQTASAGGTQDNWRWCQKCQGLWFNGNQAKGACPAGGPHQNAGSSNYRLTQVG